MPLNRDNTTQHTILATHRDKLINDITKHLTNDNNYTQHSAISRPTIFVLAEIGILAFILGAAISSLTHTVTPVLVATALLLALLICPHLSVFSQKKWKADTTKIGQLLESRYGTNYTSTSFIKQETEFIQSLNQKPSTVNKDLVKQRVAKRLDRTTSFQAPTEEFAAIDGEYGSVDLRDVAYALRDLTE